MGRQKKIKNIQLDFADETKKEVPMTQETAVAIREEEQLETLQAEIDAARLELEKTKKEIAEVIARREIDKDERAIIDKQISRIDETKVKSDILERQKAYDKVPVTGKFMNRRNPGQTVKLPYIKYADDPVKWHTFEEGKVYTIPRGFADQINEHYHIPRFVQKEGQQVLSSELGENSAIASIDNSNKKYAFVPTSFL
jgi:hypothetical protein